MKYNKRKDYRCEDTQDRKKSWQVKKRQWCNYIGLDSLFQKTPSITPKTRTVQRHFSQEIQFEDTTFKPGFEIAKL
jgi:hypothetical protein